MSRQLPVVLRSITASPRFFPLKCISRWRLFGALVLLFTAAATRPALAAPASVETCNEPGNVLPAGNVDTDLEVSNGINCIVDGTAPDGTYLYRNVNIWNGTLTFRDAKINFHAHSILVENGGTLQAGFDPTKGPVAGPITLWLYGASDDGVPSITCKSSATCGVPGPIWTSNENVVMKEMPHGACVPASNFGPPLGPVGTGCFYQYDLFEPGETTAGAFFGRKVLAVSYGGNLLLRGQKGIRSGAMDADPADSGTSWVRLTDTLNPGAQSFHVDRTVPTWASGDHLALTSTDYLPGHSEEVVIQSVQNDAKGTLITLNKGVTYPHYGTAYDFSGIAATSGPRDDPDGPKTLPSRHIETRAAVALLTHSIMVASEGPQPVLSGRDVPHFTQGYYGGHTLFRQGFEQLQIQGVEFYQLGQGGAIGHYPVHFHMDRTVPPFHPAADPALEGTYITDSSIHDSNTRFITLHATQGVLVARNVGFRSIGHGFYLEDATEINNRLYSNIGIQARAAVDDDLNDRKVPGILSRNDNNAGEVFPFHSDFDHPSIFWIMNTWNDFRYNVAVGAGTCGACYWMPPAANSGPSVYETWDSYASAQTRGREGAVPLMNFVGNSCSTAMSAIQTVGDTAACLGVKPGPGSDTQYLYSIPNPQQIPDNAYPAVGLGQREHATLCDPSVSDCSTIPLCSGTNGNEGQCAATVIDHFSSSFTWAQKNFAAIWLRGWWFLMTDSAVTDPQSGGLTFVTGGGYTRADAAQGYWSLSHHNIYVGNTQPNLASGQVPQNAAASNAGPFNPYAEKCAYNPQFCISRSNGVSFQNEAFNGGQRLFNIYDGPSFEDSDAFADVHTTTVGELGQCKPGGNNAGSCVDLGWMNAYTPGVLQKLATNNSANDCVLPNAAIAWKQPNGFYYPPAFHSTNLAFSNVDIRHFVIQPLWLPDSFQQDPTATKNVYCTWEGGQFTNFTDVDRQTELSDDSGSLTGLTSNTEGTAEPSISVTRDPFFSAPLVTPECSSSVPGLAATVDTSPYQYVTTAIYTPCGAPGGSCNAAPKTWGADCGSQSCYGVPLYRQYLTDDEFKAYQTDPTTRPQIRMMGQGTGQRSNMTFNHGSYYIDTTVPLNAQNVANPNVFLAGHPYYIYFLYATPSFHQTYSMYIGKVSEQQGLAAVTPGRIGIDSGAYSFTPASGNWISNKVYDPDTGLLTVTVDLSQQSAEFANDRPKFCQPQSYCSYKGDTCGCRPGSNCKEDSVCSWAVKDIDCPINGCFGFSVTMTDKFLAAKQINLPPTPIRFVGDPASDPFFRQGNVTFENATETVAGSCYYRVPPTQP